MTPAVTSRASRRSVRVIIASLLTLCPMTAFSEVVQEDERAIANMAYLAPYVTAAGGHDRIIVLSPTKAARVLSNGLSKFVNETERCVFEIEGSGDISYRIDLRRLSGEFGQRCRQALCSFVAPGFGDVTCTLKAGKVQGWCLPEIQFIGTNERALAALSYVVGSRCPTERRSRVRPPY